jgi:long-chain acyl-CoA synthetase
MDRFWLKSYPPGVPADIDPSVYPSLVSLLEESFANTATPRPMSAWARRSPSARSTLSAALAAWLQGRG